MDLAMVIRADGDDLLLRVKAVPGASRSKVVGLLGDRLKIAVSAPAEGGKANKMIVETLARALGLAKGRVEMIRGQGAALKTLRLVGMSMARGEQLLEGLLGG